MSKRRLLRRDYYSGLDPESIFLKKMKDQANIYQLKYVANGYDAKEVL